MVEAMSDAEAAGNVRVRMRYIFPLFAGCKGKLCAVASHATLLWRGRCSPPKGERQVIAPARCVMSARKQAIRQQVSRLPEGNHRPLARITLAGALKETRRRM
jgi:hypothetical protein